MPFPVKTRRMSSKSKMKHLVAGNGDNLDAITLRRSSRQKKSRHVDLSESTVRRSTIPKMVKNIPCKLMKSKGDTIETEKRRLHASSIGASDVNHDANNVNIPKVQSAVTNPTTELVHTNNFNIQNMFLIQNSALFQLVPVYEYKDLTYDSKSFKSLGFGNSVHTHGYLYSHYPAKAVQNPEVITSRFLTSSSASEMSVVHPFYELENYSPLKEYQNAVPKMQICNPDKQACFRPTVIYFKSNEGKVSDAPIEATITKENKRTRKQKGTEAKAQKTNVPACKIPKEKIPETKKYKQEALMSNINEQEESVSPKIELEELDVSVSKTTVSNGNNNLKVISTPVSESNLLNKEKCRTDLIYLGKVFPTLSEKNIKVVYDYCENQRIPSEAALEHMTYGHVVVINDRFGLTLDNENSLQEEKKPNEKIFLNLPSSVELEGSVKLVETLVPRGEDVNKNEYVGFGQMIAEVMNVIYGEEAVQEN